MKKTVLTFVAVAFGTCVAFAQTTPVNKEGDKKVNTEQNISIEKVADKPEDVAGRRVIKMEELPVAIQASLKEGEFKGWKVVNVAELAGNAQNPAATYEVELISEDMKDEIKDSQEATEELKEEVVEEGGVAEEQMVAVKVPGVVLRYDKAGKLLSRTERANDQAPVEKQEQK